MEEKKYTRVILNVPTELNEKYIELSKKRGISKSAMIMYSMSWFLDYNNSLELMPQMLNAYNDLKKGKETQIKDKSE